MLRVRFSENANLVVDEKNVKNYFNLIDKQFLDIFLPSHRKYIIVNENEKADICILGTQHTNNDLLRDNELNIFITIENFSVNRPYYNHFNKFDRFNNPKVHLYIYSDMIMPTNNMIPAIYQYIRYFDKILLNESLYYDKFKNNYEQINTEFHKKKFCLFISRNNLNENKQKLINKLSLLGNIDFIQNISYEITKSSCYNSFELLYLFNKYKFIICVENSKTEGYITEKIFNIFLAKSIPIYDGDDNITNFINKDSFLIYDENIFENVKMIFNNENLYNDIINKNKIKKLDYTFINSNFDFLVNKYSRNF
jgi:hypothetical protein